MVRRKHVPLILALTFLATMAVCTWGPDEYTIWRWKLADVEADVAGALSRGDARFRVCQRAGLFAPGIQGETGDPLAEWDLIQKQGWDPMPGISCISGSGRYGDAAKGYAERYNRALLRKLGISLERLGEDAPSGGGSHEDS